MKRFTALWLTALVLGMAVPALGHEGGPEVHEQVCDGKPAWTEDVSTYDATIQEMHIVLYTDRGADGEGSPDARPGVLWMESNGWEKLQKTDFECESTDGAHDDEELPHPDTVIL